MGFFSDLVSDMSSWIDPPARQWNSVGGQNDNLEYALAAAQDANSLLSTARPEVGSTIPLAISNADLEEIRRRRIICKTFTDGIHYEVAELVDEPFSLALEPVINAVYDLNPKDFKVKRGIFGWGKADTLEDLLIDTIQDTSLKEAFEKQCKNLDEDEVSAGLKEALKEAKFWEKEFEKAREIEAIAQTFYDKYSAQWDSMTQAEQIDALKKYSTQISDIMDARKWYEPFRKHIVFDVQWATQDTYGSGSSGAYGYTYSSQPGIIYINDSFGTGNPPQFDLQKLINTVTHETRHQYQTEAVNNPDRFNVPTNMQTDWSSRPIDYWTRPIEIDARAFAGMAAIS